MIDFLKFPPSVIAAAAVTSIAGANLLDTLDDRVDRVSGLILEFGSFQGGLNGNIDQKLGVQN